MARYLKLRVFVLSYQEAHYFLNNPAALTENLSRNGKNCKWQKKPNTNTPTKNQTTSKKPQNPPKHPHRKQSCNMLFTKHSPATSPAFWAQSSSHIQGPSIKCKITIPLCRDDTVWLNWWSYTSCSPADSQYGDGWHICEFDTNFQFEA